MLWVALALDQVTITQPVLHTLIFFRRQLAHRGFVSGREPIVIHLAASNGCAAKADAHWPTLNSYGMNWLIMMHFLDSCLTCM